jgi:hypothetical protein
MREIKTTQRILDLAPRTKLRVSEVERLIDKHRIIVPPLSRRMIYAMCDDGTFEHVKYTNKRRGYFIYEDSFLKWVKELDAESGRPS